MTFYLAVKIIVFYKNVENFWKRNFAHRKGTSVVFMGGHEAVKYHHINLQKTNQNITNESQNYQYFF